MEWRRATLAAFSDLDLFGEQKFGLNGAMESLRLPAWQPLHGQPWNPDCVCLWCSRLTPLAPTFGVRVD